MGRKYPVEYIPELDMFQIFDEEYNILFTAFNKEDVIWLTDMLNKYGK